MKTIVKERNFEIITDHIGQSCMVNQKIEDGLTESLIIFDETTFRIEDGLWWDFLMWTNLLDPSQSNIRLPEVEMQ